MKVILTDQISELQRMLSHHREMFPKQVKRLVLRQEEADARIARLEQAIATLAWVQRNADTIKTVHRNGRSAR